MKIGTKEYPDNCPNCQKLLVKKPLGKEEKVLAHESKTYLLFQVVCLFCNHTYPPVKIDADIWMEDQRKQQIEDVTPTKTKRLRKILFG